MSENFLKKLFETEKEPEDDPGVHENLNKVTERLEGNEEKQTNTPEKNDESDDEKIENYKEMNLDRPEE